MYVFFMFSGIGVKFANVGTATPFNRPEQHQGLNFRLLLHFKKPKQHVFF